MRRRDVDSTRGPGDSTAVSLPNFFIVGAAKSGTTSLYHYLSQHPDVYMSPNKEPHWFSRVRIVPGQGSHPVTSEEEYLKLFDARDGEPVAGEASPSYLWDEHAPSRIAGAVPHAKIIAILRHPVKRAHSHYLMQLREGKEDLSFAEAVEQDLHADPKAWSVSRLYVDLGFYAEQVQRYLGAFDRSQIKIFLYEDLREDPRALLESVLEFLEVDPRHAASIRMNVQSNRYAAPRKGVVAGLMRSSLFKSRSSSALRAKLLPNHQVRARIREALLYKEGPKRPEIDPPTEKLLMDLYREDIRKLQGLIGRDLGHWLGADRGR